MDNTTVKELEVIFRTSSSPDELFDAFGIAIKSRIRDQDLYKTLLRNKALSTDEISMFAEKICREFSDLSYNIYFCVGQLFESISSYCKHHDKAFGYYKKAASSQPDFNEPYLAMAKMYNHEFNIPKFESVAQEIESGISIVEIKSPLCFLLANLYHQKGEKDKGLNYQKLGEIFQREGK